MYREIKGQAYCRREYMGGVPANRITQFEHGVKADYPVRMTLRAVEQCQIRHIALEAARISANRLLAKKIGTTGYHMKIRVYPHNVIRENKIATGAGADRISEGMRAAFGKPVGTAARIKRGPGAHHARDDGEPHRHGEAGAEEGRDKVPDSVLHRYREGAEEDPGRMSA